MLHLTLLIFMELVEDGEKFLGTVKVHQDFPQSITGDSIKDFCQFYESCIYYRLCSVLCICLLYLPQHRDHVCGPSVRPEPALAFWHVFLCYLRDEPVQQNASQNCACNEEYSDASVV